MVKQEHDPERYVEAVLALVERIPPGRVMTYGMIAEVLRDQFGQGSPRRVGTIMSRDGGPVPWHRVVNSSGRVTPGYESEAVERLTAEGIVLRNGRVPLVTYSWFPPA